MLHFTWLVFERKPAFDRYFRQLLEFLKDLDLLDVVDRIYNGWVLEGGVLGSIKKIVDPGTILAVVSDAV